MRRVDVRAVRCSILVSVVGSIATLPAGARQLESHGLPTKQLWTGRVHRPDGSPAAGAVVVTSAGGRTLSAEDGSFALTLELPDDAQAVEVTATLADRSGSGALVARERLVPGSGANASLGILQLQTSDLPAPDWRATFGARPGLIGAARALAVHDDGNGPALYVGGTFTSAGGAASKQVARWDGARWSSLDGGVDAGTDVDALVSFDDGNGAVLIAGGTFTSIGGVAANNVARWDGSAWAHLGSGMVGSVLALTVFDDGSGPALYAGGHFTVAGGLPASRVARWNGLSWNTLGLGTNGSVNALAAFDDGSGPALYAAGDFTMAGGVAANRIARWDGTHWSAVGSGFAATVRALAVFDDGSGPALYAGGVLSNSPQRLARWNGTTWSMLGSMSAGEIHALGVYDDGSGTALYCGGTFASCVAKWSGSGFIPLPTVSWQVQALTAFDDGEGPELFAAGFFSFAGTVPANGIGRWDGTQWSTVGTGVNEAVRAVLDVDLGTGLDLYAGGAFSGAGGAGANRIARFDGTSWSPLGSGLDGVVHTLARFDDGTGPALYAGGAFTTAGGAPARTIARWNGASWSALGSGTNGTVSAMTTFDDGSGEALYVGGRFTGAGGAPATLRIARWNGASWSSVGGGGANGAVNALVVHDDGSGPALYACGEFAIIGGVATRCVARWDGSIWSAFSNGITQSFVPPTVHALAVFDAGSGPELYAGGSFWIGSTSTNIARWNGSSWSALPAGGTDANVFALAVHDDGGGPALFAGGSFTHAGGLAVDNVARFDGSGWSALAEGTSGPVRAFASSPRGLRVGGDFLDSPAGDSFVASWAARRKATRER